MVNDWKITKHFSLTKFKGKPPFNFPLRHRRRGPMVPVGLVIVTVRYYESRRPMRKLFVFQFDFFQVVDWSKRFDKDFVRFIQKGWNNQLRFDLLCPRAGCWRRATVWKCSRLGSRCGWWPERSVRAIIRIIPGGVWTVIKLPSA